MKKELRARTLGIPGMRDGLSKFMPLNHMPVIPPRQVIGAVKIIHQFRAYSLEYQPERMHRRRIMPRYEKPTSEGQCKLIAYEEIKKGSCQACFMMHRNPNIVGRVEVDPMEYRHTIYNIQACTQRQFEQVYRYIPAEDMFRAVSSAYATVMPSCHRYVQQFDQDKMFFEPILGTYSVKVHHQMNAVKKLKAKCKRD